jgi:predicted Zn-dependent protease with MMP-like domain
MLSEEFLELASLSLTQITAMLDPIRQADLTYVSFYVQDTPSPEMIQDTNTKPNQILLGIYTSGQKPTIHLFEDSLRRMANYNNSTLYEQTYNTLYHEIFQHYFGLNHSARSLAKKAQAMGVV